MHLKIRNGRKRMFHRMENYKCGMYIIFDSGANSKYLKVLFS